MHLAPCLFVFLLIKYRPLNIPLNLIIHRLKIVGVVFKKPNEVIPFI